MTGTAPRWAVSFADLGLLLLGCFIYLHVASGPAARASAPTPAAQFAADPLFHSDEARLNEEGLARVSALARSGSRYRLVSTGLPPANSRLDGFELASARAAVVARAMRDTGARVEVELRSEDGTQQLAVLPIS